MSRFASPIVGNPGSHSSCRLFPVLCLPFAEAVWRFLLCAPGPRASLRRDFRQSDGSFRSDRFRRDRDGQKCGDGRTRTTITDDAGQYSMPSLAVGEYEVRITKQGFQEQVRGGIHLAVGQEASVDLALKLGQVTEQVKVTRTPRWSA